MATLPALTYPRPPTADQVDDYHGTPVADPYRPLEDSDSPETRAWIDAQNELTADVLERHSGRAAIRSRLTELWDYPRAGAPWRRGDRWFQFRNTGLEDQDVLWTADSAEAIGNILIDPNDLSGEGTTALTAVAVSEDGGYVALGLSRAGSDWRSWRVRSIDTGEELPDRIEWSKFASAAWTHDGAGFFYGRYPEPPGNAAYDAPNVDMELRYHRLGTDAADDQLVFSVPAEHDWVFEPEVSDDGRLLIVTIVPGTGPESRIYVADLSNGVQGARMRPVLNEADARYEHIATIGRTIYLVTDRDAPLGRVIAVDADDPAKEREVIVETDETLEHVRLVGDRLAAAYLHDAGGRLAVCSMAGTSRRTAAGDRLDRRDVRASTRRRALPDIRHVRVSPDGPRRPDGRRRCPPSRATDAGLEIQRTSPPSRWSRHRTILPYTALPALSPRPRPDW